MYTVCGQAQPHQTRPNSAVTRKIAIADAHEQQHEQQRVGGQEGGAEERELAPRQVEQDERLAVDPQVGDDEEHDHQRVRHDPPPPPERACDEASGGSSGASRPR